MRISYVEIQGFRKLNRIRVDLNTTTTLLVGANNSGKGLEFPRVMVLIDDEEARGFMFSYDKLFGVKGQTKTDLENERSGKETSIDRTRRLLYVTCSRCEQSLALVAYTSNAAGLHRMATTLNWFKESEVEYVSA
jgi:DNA helicase-2/ATP-dependent DNA helicase PcrA